MKQNFFRRTLPPLLLLTAVPLAVWLCARFDRKYYIGGSVVILLTFLAFFLRFEERRPQARELVLLAVMTALTVASRAIFAALPHVKPMTALILLSGIALGPEAGFLNGALSAFVSNFLFGQGPWTPWQMFAYGVGGLLAGLFARWGLLKRTPKKASDLAALAAFGFLTVVCLTGPLLDTCTLVTMAGVINTASIGAVYLSGLPVNLLHGCATLLTLLLVGRPFLGKLKRIQDKYGMADDGKIPCQKRDNKV